MIFSDIEMLGRVERLQEIMKVEEIDVVIAIHVLQPVHASLSSPKTKNCDFNLQD